MTLKEPSMIDPNTESQPLPEKLLPQTSIRFFLMLIGASALVMLVFRSASGGSSWARIVSLLITNVGACFMVYAILFLIANLLSSTTEPIVRVIDAAPVDERES